MAEGAEEDRTRPAPGRADGSATGVEARRRCGRQRIRNIGMVPAIAIILWDGLLFVLFVSESRQELGISVNGPHDLPVVRKKPVQTPPPPATGNAAGRGRQVVVRS